MCFLALSAGIQLSEAWLAPFPRPMFGRCMTGPNCLAGALVALRCWETLVIPCCP